MSRTLDTLDLRWARLKPHVTVYGPPGRRPTVLLFHGCGGVGVHMGPYAEAAAAVGVRAVVVDSFAARGWSDAFGIAFVCTGLTLWGRERAGDVLAAVHGAVKDLDADPDALALAGWSHGGWSIMDLMTMPLERPGEAGLADPSGAVLAGLKGLFLCYPYGGFGVLTRHRPWVRQPKTFAILATRDHVTRPADSEQLYARMTAAGCEPEIWRVDGSHGFEEPHTALSPMRFDADLSAQAVERFAGFLRDRLPGG